MWMFSDILAKRKFWLFNVKSKTVTTRIKSLTSWFQKHFSMVSFITVDCFDFDLIKECRIKKVLNPIDSSIQSWPSHAGLGAYHGKRIEKKWTWPQVGVTCTLDGKSIKKDRLFGLRLNWMACKQIAGKAGFADKRLAPAASRAHDGSLECL